MMPSSITGRTTTCGSPRSLSDAVGRRRSDCEGIGTEEAPDRRGGFDGKFLVYSQYGEKTKDDLWLLPLDGDRKPIPYLQSPSNEVLGSFSPNGRWMAYVSDESGPLQVYVQTIPPSGDQWQVSTAGGTGPRWRRDGRELFYVAPDQKLMAVPVKSGWAASGPFEVGTPQPLFGDMLLVGFGPNRVFYQPTADGQRFMVIARSGGEAFTTPPITVVTNWQATLKK